jgi:hypothetical protein
MKQNLMVGMMAASVLPCHLQSHHKIIMVQDNLGEQ